MTQSPQSPAWPFPDTPENKAAPISASEVESPGPTQAPPNVKQIVKDLMECDHLDDSGLPAGFDAVDPVAFVKQLARYRDKSLGTLRYGKLIKTYACGDAAIANTLLALFEKAQPEVTGKVMARAVEALQISLDYNVMGAEIFLPKLMPNGAIVIRNHHRVIGIDESPSVRLRLRNTELRAELAKVVASMDTEARDEASLIQFSIIHRQPDGTIVRTRTLPEQLSDWGQTLVFIGDDLDLSASDRLVEADIASVCAASRTGVAILRVFADCALVYGTHRASDDFDTILEEYAEHAFDDLDDPAPIRISQDREQIRSAVIRRTEEWIEGTDLKRPESGIMRHYFDEIMLSARNWESYASQKLVQINAFTPFFHAAPDRPVHYYAAHDPYWGLSEEFGHKIAVVQLPMQAFADIEDFEYNFAEVIESRLFAEAGFPPHQTLLLTEELDWKLCRDCAVELDSDPARDWFGRQAAALREQFDQAMSEDPERDEGEALRDIMVYGDTQVRVVLVFAEKPDYLELDRLMKTVSGHVDGGGNLSVPHVGFCQGYDCGGYDTGNAPVLLTQDEIEDED